MASDRNISITLRANNLMAKGMADAKATIKSFGNTVRTVSRGLIGPITGLIAIFMAVRKAVGAWTEMLRAGEEGAARGRIAALGETVRILERDYKVLTEEIKKRNAAMKNGQADMDKEIKATRELSDAQRELAKQKALAAIDPGDAEGRKVIERDFEIGDAAEAAARKVKDLRLEQERLANESKRRADDAAQLAEEYKKQKEAANQALQASVDLSSRATKQSGVFRASLDKGSASAAATQAAKDARELAQKLLDARKQTLKDEREALDESERLSRQAAAVQTQVKAAEIAQQALLAKEANKDAFAEAEERNKRMIEMEREAARQRLEMKRELERNEQQLAREIKQREIKDMQEQLQAEKNAQQEAAEIANMRVEDMIEAARKEQEALKEREREAAKAAKLEADIARGVRLDKKSQQFLEAFRKREAAAEEAAQIQGNVARLEADLKLAQEGNKTLQDIRKELADTQQMLKELIPLG